MVRRQMGGSCNVGLVESLHDQEGDALEVLEVPLDRSKAVIDRAIRN